MELDRLSAISIIASGLSVAASYLCYGSGEFTVRHGGAMLIPLALVVLLDVTNMDHGLSLHAYPRWGGRPGPVFLLRAVAFVLIVTMIVCAYVVQPFWIVAQA